MSDLVIPRGRIFNTAVATATDFFGTALAASRACAMRVTVALAAAARVDARITSDAVTVAGQLNGGNDLDANALRTFFVPLRPGDTLNFRHDDAGPITVLYLLVDECQGPVAATDPTANEVTVSVAPGGLGKAEDDPHATGDVGVEMLSVRRDTAATSAGAAGDYAAVNTDATGHLWTRVGPGARDTAAGATDLGAAALAIRDDALSAVTPAEGDYEALRVTASGAVWVDLARQLPAGVNNIGDVDVVSVVTGTGATNLGKAEDAVAGDGDVGVMALTVRRDAAATSAGAAGDYATANTDATGNLWVRVGPELPAGTQNIGDVDIVSHVPGTGATNAGKARDAAAGATDTGMAPFAIRDDALSAVTPVEGDYEVLRVTASGALWVAHAGGLPAGTNNIGDVDVLSVVTGTGATNLGKAEDAVAGDGDVGVMALTVRRDAAATSAGAAGDYATANTDATGNLWVRVGPELPAGTQNIGDVDVVSVVPGTAATNLGKAVDAVPGATDTGIAALALRDDALAALTPADGDYTHLRVTASGAMWVTHAGALPAGTNNIGDVDIVSHVPGTAATNLGKARDAASAGTDTGVAMLAIRDDALSAVTPIEGDYELLRVTQSGALWAQLIGALPAGTAHLGQLGGESDVASITLPTQTAAYAAEDALTGAFTYSNVARVAGEGVLLDMITVTENVGAAAERPELHVFFTHSSFGTAPAANATMSSGAGAVFGDTDLLNLIGPFTITTGDWEFVGQDAIARIEPKVTLPPPASGRNYGCLVKTGTALASRASRSMRIKLGVAQD